MNNLQELLEKIDADKEVLNVLPRNNKKNIKIYLLKNQTLQEEFKTYKQEILKEVEKRFNKIKNVKENTKISKLEKELCDTEESLYLLNNIDTSYEKMDLDRAIQNLSYYYKKNLEIVNESILFTIRKFEEVGIRLTESDFCYSNYVKEYIKTFFIELRKHKNIDSEKIKTKFEEIYWKCPDIITHIALNFKYLYLKNEKNIDKYYEQQKNKVLQQYKGENIINEYIAKERELIEEKKADKADLIKKLLSGELNVKEYSKENIKSQYSKFISDEHLKDLNEAKLNEIDVNMIKFLNSLYEYSKYYKFKFVIEDIKNIYAEKDKYKNVYSSTKKEIDKKEKKVKELNNKINGKGLFKKPNDKFINEQNSLILELRDLYKELDKNKVYNKIYTELKDSSTLSDVLNFASSFYKYLFDCIRKYNEGISEDEVEQFITELIEFTKWPYCTIINNIKILDEKDIVLIIKDRYKLLNINISKEDLEGNNLDSVMESLEKIETNYNIRKNKINIEDITYMCEFKKILKK